MVRQTLLPRPLRPWPYMHPPSGAKPPGDAFADGCNGAGIQDKRVGGAGAVYTRLDHDQVTDQLEGYGRTTTCGPATGCPDEKEKRHCRPNNSRKR